MKKSKKYLSLMLSCAFFIEASPSHAFAPIPTIDASAIAEGIMTNIELVKQSKIVTEATKEAGEIKSAIGTAKSSLSDLENSEAAEAIEKAKKEKENFEKAKEAYEEYKEKYESAKQAAEENKERLQKHKEELEKGISEAQSAYSQAQETYTAATEMLDSLENNTDSKNTENKTGNSAGTNQYNYGGESNYQPTETSRNESKTEEITQNSVPTQIEINTPQSTNSSQNLANEKTSEEEQELQAALSEIEMLKAQLAELMGQNNTQEYVSPEDLNAAKEEIAKLKAELKKYKEQEEGLSTNSDGEFEETSSNDGLPTEEAPDNPTEETSDLPETITEPNKENTSRGFRKIQTIDKNEVFDRRSELNSKKEIFTASYSRTETLKFAKEETTDETTPLTDAPTGKNAATDEYIISDELAQYCNLNINKASESEIRDCLEKLIAYQSETNMTTAEKGKNFVYSVLYDAAIALTAEAAYYKNVASNYKTDVLGPKKTDENKSQTDTRDDIKVLSSNVKLLQALMANVNKIYASRLLYEGLNEATQYQLKDVNSSTADTSSGTDEKTTEKGA